VSTRTYIHAHAHKHPHKLATIFAQLRTMAGSHLPPPFAAVVGSLLLEHASASLSLLFFALVLAHVIGRHVSSVRVFSISRAAPRASIRRTNARLLMHHTTSDERTRGSSCITQHQTPPRTTLRVLTHRVHRTCACMREASQLIIRVCTTLSSASVTQPQRACELTGCRACRSMALHGRHFASQCCPPWRGASIELPMLRAYHLFTGWRSSHYPPIGAGR